MDEEDEILAEAKEILSRMDWIMAMTAAIAAHMSAVSEIVELDGIMLVPGVKDAIEGALDSGALMMALFAENPKVGINLKDGTNSDEAIN